MTMEGFIDERKKLVPKQTTSGEKLYGTTKVTIFISHIYACCVICNLNEE